MSKPEWAQRFALHAREERLAQVSKRKALALRCEALEGGGARCTADARPAHDHRYDAADLPDLP